jgi:Bacterial regulatory proteins, luxR family
VADLVAEGRSNADVAASLLMGVETVKTHPTRVYAKLGIKNAKTCSSPPAGELICRQPARDINPRRPDCCSASPIGTAFGSSYGSGMGTFSWAEAVAKQRGWDTFEIPKDRNRFGVRGRCSVTPWECVLYSYSSDGNTLRSISWNTSLTPVSSAPGTHFSVHERTGLDFSPGATGVGAADAAVAGLTVLRGLLKRQKAGPQPTLDIASALAISDPTCVMTGALLTQYAHWPIVASNTLATGLRKLDAVIATKPTRPPDAPSTTLVARVTPDHPLSLVAEGWWDRPTWLEHHIDLGVAIAEALVRTGFLRTVPA